jgi:hypothetical protein
MDIKKELKEKLPEKAVKSPEFNTLLKLVKDEGIGSAAELREYLEENIGKINEWLEENRTAGTITDERREKVRELEFLELIKEKVMKHL